MISLKWSCGCQNEEKPKPTEDKKNIICNILKDKLFFISDPCCCIGTVGFKTTPRITGWKFLCMWRLYLYVLRCAHFFQILFKKCKWRLEKILLCVCLLLNSFFGASGKLQDVIHVRGPSLVINLLCSVCAVDGRADIKRWVKLTNVKMWEVRSLMMMYVESYFFGVLHTLHVGRGDTRAGQSFLCVLLVAF